MSESSANIIAPYILSVSRATDIPAFYSEWFFNRLKEGYCKWKNPFSGKENIVSFNSVRFIVFWSKNPAPLIPNLDLLKERNINFYIQFTINDYEAEKFEPSVPALYERIETFKYISKKYGKDSVIWRFDPLIITDKIGIADLIKRIEKIGSEIHSYTNKLVFSFADISTYAKVKSRLIQNNINYREWDNESMTQFAKEIKNLKGKKGWNLEMATCSEAINLAQYGIIHNSCIDAGQIAKIAYKDEILMNHLGIKIEKVSANLFGDNILPDNTIRINEMTYATRPSKNKDKGQRKLCGCIPSKDIGRYDTCPHQCVYCYANATQQLTNYINHNPKSEII
ncbi:MAG: DUF1848 domain-containing protein [Muribaculaceae bacterium]|nr:DUF1848 domain-containing protein [Muribaculaceae bacterium]